MLDGARIIIDAFARRVARPSRLPTLLAESEGLMECASLLALFAWRVKAPPLTRTPANARFILAELESPDGLEWRGNDEKPIEQSIPASKC